MMKLMLELNDAESDVWKCRIKNDFDVLVFSASNWNSTVKIEFQQ